MAITYAGFKVSNMTVWGSQCTVSLDIKTGNIANEFHGYYRVWLKRYKNNSWEMVTNYPKSGSSNTTVNLILELNSTYYFNVGFYSKSDFTEGIGPLFTNAELTNKIITPMSSSETKTLTYFLHCYNTNTNYPFCTYVSNSPDTFWMESQATIQKAIPGFYQWESVGAPSNNRKYDVSSDSSPVKMSVDWNSTDVSNFYLKPTFNTNVTYYFKAYYRYATGLSSNPGQTFTYSSNLRLLDTTSTSSVSQYTNLPSSTPSIPAIDEKYTLSGWITDGNTYNPGDEIEVKASTDADSFTLYTATYTAKPQYKYYIRFHYGPNLNDYEDVLLGQSYNTDFTYSGQYLNSYDTTILPEKKSNHTLKGWAISNTSTTSISAITFNSSHIDSNDNTAIRDVYAVWKVKHEATLNVDLSDPDIIISTTPEASSSGNIVYSHTSSVTETYTYSDYQGTIGASITISIGDTGIAGFSKPQCNFSSYSDSDGKKYPSQFGTFTFSFLPSSSTKQSLTLTPNWVERKYTFNIEYANGTLVGGDTIKDKPENYTKESTSLTHSYTVSISSPLENTLKTTKQHNIFLGYIVSFTKASLGDSCNIANGTLINSSTKITYTFDSNSTETSVTITLTPKWQSQYIFTVNFYKNSASASTSTTDPIKKTTKELKALINPPTSYTLEIPIEYGETPFDFSRTDYEVTAWLNGSSPITDEKITWEFKTSGTTYGKTINLYAVWEEAGYVWIYTSGEWKKAQPWIYCKVGTDTSPRWHKARPWIFDGTEWKHT